QGGPSYTIGSNVFELEIRAEDAARNDRSRYVGERHVVDALGESLLTTCGVDAAALNADVRQAELGPGIESWNVTESWNGMIDANIVIQYEPLEAIDWRKETAARRVSLWIPASLLNELDLLR